MTDQTHEDWVTPARLAALTAVQACLAGQNPIMALPEALEPVWSRFPGRETATTQEAAAIMTMLAVAAFRDLGPERTEELVSKMQDFLMGTVTGPLTPEQQRQLEENERNFQERLRQQQEDGQE